MLTRHAMGIGFDPNDLPEFSLQVLKCSSATAPRYLLIQINPCLQEFDMNQHIERPAMGRRFTLLRFGVCQQPVITPIRP